MNLTIDNFMKKALQPYEREPLGTINQRLEKYAKNRNRWAAAGLVSDPWSSKYSRIEGRYEKKEVFLWNGVHPN